MILRLPQPPIDPHPAHQLGEIIAQQYDELIKFATALRLETADVEAILRRFTQANVQHPTYRALVELGRALKTAFLCDNFRLESLRREIHAGLNTIETWNSANDFIVYGKGGELREQYGGGPGNVNVGVALAPSLLGVYQYADDPTGTWRTGVAGTADAR